MPSVDVIRNVKVQGSAPGVDDATAALNRLTDSIKAANENLAKSNAAANDNSAGFRITGESAATAANHLRQAAEAAYAFSPAFRGVVNEMAVPVLGAASAALSGVAAGIVTATNYAGTGLIAVAGAAEKASPSLLGYTTAVRSAGIAMEGFTPTATTAAGSILSFLAPALRLTGWFLLAVKGIEDVGEAWRLGGEKLAEYVALSEKAASTGVSTDFFQRISKAATDAKQPVDDLLASIKKLGDVSTPKLGGSDLQNRLDELTKAGNFSGNTGVSQLANATTLQEKWAAIISLTNQAFVKGEALAALDLTSKFLSPSVQAALQRDNEYLNKMKSAADSVASTDLVPNASVDNAVALQNRLDAAEKILSERWHPIQDLLTQGGIAMREAWVSIVENIAAAFDQASKLMAKLGEAPAWFQSMLNKGAIAFMDATTTPESRAAAEKQFGISSNPADIAMLAARQRLASGLGNPANVSAATDQINAIQNKVFPDKSKDPNAQGPDTSAYDRAEESVLKYIETTKAASLAVSDAAGEQEKFKVIAQLTAAGMKDGLTPEAAKLKAEMSGLGEKAGIAADALAKAKVVSQIEFQGKTAFLSQEDVSIATQLKGIYGNDVPAALNSTYAAAIRTNNAFKEISSAIETNLTQGLTDIVSGTKSVSQGFTDMANSVVRAIEQMIIKIAIVQPLMAQLQASASSLGILPSVGPLTVPGAIGPTSINGAPLVALHGGGIVGSEATFTRYVHPAYFDDAPRFHSGGIAGDEVPIIARRGEGVFTAGQMAALGAMGAPQVNVTLIESPNGGGTVTQRSNSNGGIDIEVAIAQISAKSAATPGAPVNRVLTDGFGARRQLASR